MVEPVSTHVKPTKGQKYYLYVQNINKLKYLLVYVKNGSRDVTGNGAIHSKLKEI